MPFHPIDYTSIASPQFKANELPEYRFLETKSNVCPISWKPSVVQSFLEKYLHLCGGFTKMKQLQGLEELVDRT